MIKLNPDRKSIFSLIAGTSSNTNWLLKSVSHTDLASAVEYASSLVGIFNHLCKAKGRVNENIPCRNASLGQDDAKPALGLLHLESFIPSIPIKQHLCVEAVSQHCDHRRHQAHNKKRFNNIPNSYFIIILLLICILLVYSDFLYLPYYPLSKPPNDQNFSKQRRGLDNGYKFFELF